MRWQNFANFSALNLQLGWCLDWHIGPPMLRCGGSHPEFTRRSWVEQQVDYVAVRPFGSLDMQATDTKDDGANIIYSIWHHIEGEERPYSRVRYLDSDGPDTTIRQLIDGLVKWYSEYWALQPGQPRLIVDVVVRHTTKRHPEEKYYRESVELFLFPAEAQPQA
ncbi:MAG TPA: hypothetical protein VFZ58_04365 [Candidatus Saccharimonadales bacterium]